MNLLNAAFFFTPGIWMLPFGTAGVATASFGTSVTAEDVAVQSDGKTVVAGTSSTGDFAVARLNLDGTLDSTFGQSRSGTVLTHVGSASKKSAAHGMALQSDGKIVVVGAADLPSSGASGEFGIIRYNADGSLDTTFSGDGKLTVDFGLTSVYSGASRVVVQSDGKIVVGGFGDHETLRTAQNFDLPSNNSAKCGKGQAKRLHGGGERGAENACTD